MIEYSELDNETTLDWKKIPVKKTKNYLRAVEEYIEPTDIILDFGNTGKRKILATVKKYYDLDNDKKVRVDFHDIKEIPPSLKFDKIIMTELIEHIHWETVAQILVELRKHLTPQGMLIITTPNSYNLKTHRMLHIQDYSPKDIRNLLQACGYTPTLYRLWTIPTGLIEKIINYTRQPLSYYLGIDLNCAKILATAKVK